ncbi:MAG: bifunctional DNA-formamidopyrimidine glycosylase/DNA-(apurinic or apyrimidinic site) lyase [Anaerolineales bacterium]|nr:bifunctional DNA-formamidopyrimidine glycosylase/DNA-(apurinic or apyrimidinic site) lyase [Anaerolineales bacterium]
MPELPEVETFRRYLLQGETGSPSILGKKIKDADLLWERTLAAPSPADFKDRIRGQFVTGVGRRGKNLLIRLSWDTLIIHLRMSGELVVEEKTNPPGKHYRLILNFTDKYRLAFNNIRKFGRVWLVEDPVQVIGNLGPEPLADDFTPELFHQILQKHSRQLKYFLLDQEMIAGLGNIYTDEALYRAKLHPAKKTNSVNSSETQRLWLSIREVLQEGIENQGSSIDWMYQGGDYQKYLSVYNLEGKPCKYCKTPIKRIKIAQRSTYFCPTCQPLPE